MARRCPGKSNYLQKQEKEQRDLTLCKKRRLSEEEQELTQSSHVNTKKKPEANILSNFVWAKFGPKYHWPAFIIDPSDCGQTSVRNGHTWVFWFGDHLISQVSMLQMRSFMHSFSEMYSTSHKRRVAAIIETLEILAKMDMRNFDKTDDLIAWAKDGFLEFSPQNHDDLTMLLRKCLNPSRTAMTEEIAETSNDGSKTEKILADILQAGCLNPEDICISCYGQGISGHPFFIGGHCTSCSKLLKETIFTIGEDGKNMCCIICAEPGSLVVCENEDCSKSYCKRCLTSILGAKKAVEIMDISPWLCFFCSPNEINNCAIRIRYNWREKLLQLFDSNVDNIVFSDFAVKRPVTVLSLFDGISTGKVVLDMLGIEIDRYYASEIDENAIIVSKINHPNSIIYLGDIANILASGVESLGNIDLVLAGSPCNDFSVANPRRKDLFDHRSSGALFFQFFCVLAAVKKVNKNVFYMFENVASMKKINKRVLSTILEEEPAKINAVYFSPQARSRFFWSNIPGVHGLAHLWNSTPSESLDTHTLDKFLSPNVGRQAAVKKIKCVTCQRNSLIQDNGLKPVVMNGRPDILWITELESLFGFPKSYTDTGHLSYGKRLQLLGKSWSIPVIKTILQPLKSFFKNK